MLVRLALHDQQLM